LCFVDRAPRGIARHGHFAFGDLADHFVVGEILDNLEGIHAQGAKGRQPQVDCRIVDSFGMKLEIDPLIDADLRDPFKVAGTRTESQPVQRLHGAFPLIESGRFFFFSSESELGRYQPSQEQGGCHEPVASTKECHLVAPH
jgi:hypothetical protein